MKSVITSTILYLLVFILTINSGFINYQIILIIIAIALLTTFFSTAFFEGNFKSKFKKSAKILFPITALVFILGYLFNNIRAFLL